MTSENNPADHASRGLTAKGLITSNWVQIFSGRINFLLMKLRWESWELKIQNFIRLLSIRH